MRGKIFFFFFSFFLPDLPLGRTWSKSESPSMLFNVSSVGRLLTWQSPRRATIKMNFMISRKNVGGCGSYDILVTTDDLALKNFPFIAKLSVIFNRFSHGQD